MSSHRSTSLESCTTSTSVGTWTCNMCYGTRGSIQSFTLSVNRETVYTHLDFRTQRDWRPKNTHVRQVPFTIQRSSPSYLGTTLTCRLDRPWHHSLSRLSDGKARDPFRTNNYDTFPFKLLERDETFVRKSLSRTFFVWYF